MSYSLHPSIDNGLQAGDPNFAGGKLYCHCSSDKVEVEIKGNVLHNHACGVSLSPISHNTVRSGNHHLHEDYI